MEQKYKLINGWTKKKVMARIKKYNNGHIAERVFTDSNSTTRCSYQALDGNRCAVGCFIPDDHPGLTFLGDVGELLFKYPDLTSHMPLENNSALAHFQGIHDDIRAKDNFYSKMKTFLNTFCKD